ncbi:sensor histidine kinase [Sphingomonas sp. RIT328]|uniref:sensor histidine kinase n=1 Tax=Sphingomonas sp. RIT328 TaxID=1470591 RepID=UPI00044D6156|nr:HAMP domain-containing sensor histidine kinase [Sphingomonas sp. RIT328]EZP53854.1 Integral membrane sensor signal transduction histidine kinase precursor [Sphingomonas sp. RIT328]
MSSSADRAAPARSIAQSIFALVIASVLVATAVFFVVTFNGPPPRDAPQSLSSIARTLRTGRLPRDGDRRWRLSIATTPPVADERWHADPRLAAALAGELGVARADVVVLTRAEGQAPGPGDALFGDYRLASRIGDRWRRLDSVEPPLLRRWHWVTLASMLVAILLLAIPAWWLAGAISQPLRRLAAAADQARAGAHLPALPDSGSREVRELARAVATMHARLAGHAEGRTTMLAAIAHDLGTPLARLAFWIEQLPDQARNRAAADIDEMRAMIRTALAFARDDSEAQAQDRLDLGSLLDSLADDMQVAGMPVTLDPGPRAVIRGDSAALRRLFGNLIDNAIRYGGSAAIGWRVDPGMVEVTIDDRGAGIDAATVERLFEPFVRGDPSRNRATGGTGLGLAIVRAIAARHGGGATLENGPTGGRARVTLPLA